MILIVSSEVKSPIQTFHLTIQNPIVPSMPTQPLFDFVNVEPYTSDLYATLLAPALKDLEVSYLRYGRRVLTKDHLYKALGTAPIKGIAFAVYRSFWAVAWGNVAHAYDSCDVGNRPPVDIFFVKYLTNTKNYRQMFHGFLPHCKTEIAYQMARNSLAAFAKYLLPVRSDSFVSTIGFNFARGFGTNLITAVTVYPVALWGFMGADQDTILTKTIRRAGYGSLKSALATVGLQIALSILPSYHKLLKFQWALIAG
jgi:hypothetical protein